MSGEIMKSYLVSILCLTLVGCSFGNRDAIVGVWQSDTLESEWGAYEMTYTLTPDGRAIQEIRLPEEEEEEPMKTTGTYRKKGDSLALTFPGDNGDPYTIEYVIETLTKETLVLKHEEIDGVCELRRSR
jgi:hypothetical protein